MKRITASLILTILLTLASVYGQNNSPRNNGRSPVDTPSLTLPNKESSVRFVVIGDTGTGTKQQSELAQVLMRYRQLFPYEFVLMVGDNMYGSEKAADYKLKFEKYLSTVA